MSGISAVDGNDYAASPVSPGPRLAGALAVAVDASVLDAALLQQAARYQLLQVDGAQALQALKGVPPAVGQHVDVSL